MKGTTNYTNLTNGQGILRLAPRMGTDLDCFTSFAMTQSASRFAAAKFVTIQALAPQILKNEIRIIRSIRS